MKKLLQNVVKAANNAMAGKGESIEGGVLPLDEMSFTAIDDSTISGTDWKGKVLLIVNVASKCGFTYQYDGLEALYESKKEDGLLVVGVPCNQFLKQESGTGEEIASFCRLNFGVTFPLLEKQDVNGPKRTELYQRLVGSKPGNGENIGWNFEKFLIDRSGTIVRKWPSTTKPEETEFVQAIETCLS